MKIVSSLLDLVGESPVEHCTWVAILVAESCNMNICHCKCVAMPPSRALAACMDTYVMASSVAHDHLLSRCSYLLTPGITGSLRVVQAFGSTGSAVTQLLIRISSYHL